MPRESKLGLSRDGSVVYRLRLPTDLMSEWRSFTQLHGEGAPEAIRALMRHLLKKPELVARTGSGRGTTMYRRSSEVDRAKKQRVVLQLTCTEVAALAEVAAENECSTQYWIVSLLRAALTGGVAVGVAELKELGKSNYHLMAIGRNLNQITHRINAEPEKNLHRLTSKRIDALAEQLAAHRARVQAVIDACSERWVLECNDER